MSFRRKGLPQASGTLCLTDGGIETDLIFHEGVDLPSNAAYILLEDDSGLALLTRYFERYLAIARAAGTGFILESATWRANPDWAMKIGTSPEEFVRINIKAVDMLRKLRDRWAGGVAPIVVSGCVGPRGDGYQPGELMSAYGAEQYHSIQIRALADGGADMICGMTITNVPEAIGITRAASRAGLPAAISFTVETDGRIPAGATLREAIEAVDAVTGEEPVYYMINCAHPAHFADLLRSREPWTMRVRGVRANASCRSHAELDAATELDEGNPEELGRQYRDLLRDCPQLTVLGGCCGTDHRHVQQIALACAPSRMQAAPR